MSAQISPTILPITGLTDSPSRSPFAPVLIADQRARVKWLTARSWMLMSATFVYAAIVTFEGLDLYATSRSVGGTPQILATTRTVQVLDDFAPLSNAVKPVSSQPPNISQRIPHLPGVDRSIRSSFPAYAKRTHEVVQSISLPDINFDMNQTPAVLLWRSNSTPPVFAPARVLSGSSKQIDHTQHEGRSESAQQLSAPKVSNSKEAVQIGAIQDLRSSRAPRQADESLLPPHPGSVNPSTYVAPRPLKQVMPNAKVYGFSVIRSPVEIEVQVNISQNGTVIDAFVPTSRNSGSRSPLAFPAIAAAKQWIFEPARMHGKNIPSDFSIRFAFQPNVR